MNLNNLKYDLKNNKALLLMSIPGIVLLLLFAYYPMTGIVIAFQDYSLFQGIKGSEWIGFENFMRFFEDPYFFRLLKNTLLLGFYNLLWSFPAPIILALLLNEVKNEKFKRITQTISYMPYFVSWVVVASIMMSLLGSEGLINEVLLKLGVIDKSVNFLSNPDYFWGLLTTANIWKGLGWSAIIYISAIAGVDQELYQAGAVDGLGRFGKVWHITIPSIMPTVVVLFILGIGNILYAGVEQQLLIGTPSTRKVYEVIDTYVYRYGIQLGNYTFGTAVGLMKSVFGFFLVWLTNFI